MEEGVGFLFSFFTPFVFSFLVSIDQQTRPRWKRALARMAALLLSLAALISYPLNSLIRPTEEERVV